MRSGEGFHYAEGAVGLQRHDRERLGGSGGGRVPETPIINDAAAATTDTDALSSVAAEAMLRRRRGRKDVACGDRRG